MLDPNVKNDETTPEVATEAVRIDATGPELQVEGD